MKSLFEAFVLLAMGVWIKYSIVIQMYVAKIVCLFLIGLSKRSSLGSDWSSL